VRFSEYLTERAMRASEYKKVINSLDGLKIGFEAEFVLAHHSICVLGDPPTIDLADIDLELDSIAELFTISSSARHRIISLYDDWVDEQRKEFVDDNLEFDEDEESEEEARERIASELFDIPSFEDWLFSEYLTSPRPQGIRARRAEALERFISDYELEPIYGWSSDNTGVMFEEYESGINFKETVNNLADYTEENFGITLLNSNHDYTTWQVTQDGSIKPDEPEKECGVEIVSPPLEYSECVDGIKKIFKLIERVGYTNKSTGFHINMSVPNMELTSEGMLKLVLLLGEDFVLDTFGRQSNSYATPVLNAFRSFIKKLPDDKKPNNFDELVSLVSDNYLNTAFNQKYRTVNFTKLRDGYLEFRAPGGDGYHREIDSILESIGRFATVIKAAVDANEGKREFYKKAMRFLDSATGTYQNNKAYSLEDYGVITGAANDIDNIKRAVERLKVLPKNTSDDDINFERKRIATNSLLYIMSLIDLFDKKPPNEKQIAELALILKKLGLTKDTLATEYPIEYYNRLKPYVKA